MLTDVLEFGRAVVDVGSESVLSSPTLLLYYTASVLTVVCLCEVRAYLLCLMLQYADPVADLIDKWGVFHARLFRDSCIFHRGSFVKVCQVSSSYHICVPYAVILRTVTYIAKEHFC